MSEKQFTILCCLLSLTLFLGFMMYWITAYRAAQEYSVPVRIYEISDINLIENNTLIALSPVYYPELKIYATITAYNPTKAQCGDNPNIMASGKRVYEGAIACPRALEFGTQILIGGVVYTCEDRTAKRYNGRFDILMFSYEDAIAFGKQVKEVEIY